MAIIKNFAPFQNLTNFETFINDTNPSSDYFRITEFQDTFTGGKNGFLIEGSEHLKESTEIKIEILDVESSPVYFTPGGGTPEYYEGVSKLISVHVYDDTPIGTGKITILGELKTYVSENGAVLPVPDEWKGIYNVKWERTFSINKNLNNETIVRFFKRPQVTITELVKKIFSKTIPTVTDTGYVHGVAEIPNVGDDITTWRAGTAYKLIRTSGSWDRDVDENQITLTNPSHTATVTEVLSDREILIDTPYTTNNLVKNFISASYSITYTDFQNQVVGDTALTGSFAKIDISQLKTFVGDVARVKVFRKSRNTVGDFQFVQESKLESTELLRDFKTNRDTELSYGRFDEYNLDNYWETSSNDHTTTIDSSLLAQAVKIDYDTSVGGVQNLTTSASFDISKDVEYTLSFKTLLDGDVGDKSIRAYLSSSDFTQDFTTISGSEIYKTRQNESHNIIATNTGQAKLVFEVKGDDWYISNASLRNAQDTSFSPDEFTLIQDIPRKAVSETFDFRFEFYDINNNYIPVDVTATGVFTGGNDFPSSTKLLTFESDRNAFRFSSGSVQNPTGQQIQFKVGKSNLTGSLTFTSQAFDVDGNYLDPSDYSQYPGKLTSVNPAGAIITINNFTGSRTDNSETPFVGSVVYTASLESLEEFETVYRLEDGDNAPQLIVTSNANQFIYEPTVLNPKPSGQNIIVRAQRKNLASLITPIEVNSGSNSPELNSGSNLPELSLVSTENGIDTYSISATTFSESFADNNFEEITYSFTGSDVFGNTQSDEITISKVINFDGISVVLSNESTSFPARSTGVIIGDLTAGSGDVQMFIGGTQITHDDVSGDGVRAKNTFDIKSVTGTNVTPISTSPTTNQYGITAFQSSKDSGSITLDIEYLAGDNATSQSFQKVVSYTKSKKAVPNVEIFIRPSAQTIDADSRGSGSISPDDITIEAREGNTNRFVSIGTISYSGGIRGTVSNETISFTDTASDMTSDTETLTIPVNFIDGETTSGQKTVKAVITRTRAGVPNVEVSVSPSAQTIEANSVGDGSTNPQSLTIRALEGGTDRFTSIDSVSYTNGLAGTISSNTITFTSDASDMTSDTATATITVEFTDSEGTVDTKDVVATISRVRKSAPVVVINANPQAQSVDSDSSFSLVSSPSSVTISVNEGGSEYSYTTGAPSSNQFNITNVTNGTNNNDGTITPDTPTGSSGTSSVVTLRYKNSEGTLFSSKTININVGVAVQGADGAVGAVGPSGVFIDVSPPTQTSTRTNDGNFASPSSFTVSVGEGEFDYTYDNTSPYATASFYIDNVTNGTNNNNGTITPNTPTSLTAVDTSFRVNYKMKNSSTRSVTRSHLTTTVLDGNTGPGIVHTGEWEVGRNYVFSNGNSGNPGTARRDSVRYNGVYYAATRQHTSTDNTNSLSGRPGDGGPWASLGSQDLFVAAKVAIFEDSFVQNTLNVGQNSDGAVSAANITLAGGSTNPYISIGQSGNLGSQGFSENGIFLGMDGGTAKLALRSNTNFMEWDGDSLNIKGSIDLVGGSLNTSISAINSATASNATAASNAQSTANTAETNAQTGISNAATAQSTADGAQSLANQVNVDFNSGSFKPNNPAPESGAGLALGNNRLGYYDGGTWKTYMDNSGQFFLTGSGGNSLSWNGTNLNVVGTISITNPEDIDISDLNNDAGFTDDTAANAAQNTANSAANAASTAQGTANSAQSTANTANTTANTANSKADKINATTGSLENPTSFTPTSAAGTTNGLHLGSDKMGFINGGTWKTYMDNSGNFFLSGTGAGANSPLSFNGSNGNLTVTAGASIGGWKIDSDAIYSGGSKGSSGNFTSAGQITLGSSGFISAPAFYIDTSGNFVQDNAAAKIKSGTNIRPWSDVFDVSTNLVIKSSTRFGGGVTNAPLSSAFTFQGNDLRLNDSIGIGTVATGIGSRFSTISTNFSNLNSLPEIGGCVLPGTKILTKRGEINVEDTKQDDIIKVYNFLTETWEWAPIDEIFKNKVNGWSHIKTKLGFELKCSNSHWLYHPSYPGHKIEVDELGVGGQLYVYHEGELKKDIIISIDTFNEEVTVYNYELERIHNYVSDGVLSHNIAKLQAIVTMGHSYKKRKSESISQGDLVKLDSNNELIKVTSAKDSSVVGILWEKYELKINDFISGSEEEGYTPYTASADLISSSLMDSFGDVIPNNETGSKELWRVASIGDSVDYNTSGSYFTLQGFKMCNQGGDVVPGDLLCSSDTAGYLMKQPSEYVVTGFDGDSNPIYEERQSHCSHTVAKCMESSSWDSNGKMENVYGYLYCG